MRRPAGLASFAFPACRLIAALGCLLCSLLCFAQDFAALQAERVAAGLQSATGIVWARDGFLVFSDTVKRRIYRLDPEAKPKATETSNGGAQGLTYDVQGRLYFGELVKRRLMRIDRKGRIESVAEAFEGKKLNGPSDVVVRRDGHIYFTDPAFAGAIDTRELPFNGVFHLTPKGELETVARWQTRPNGIALTADGKTLYVTDADRHAVVAFTLDGKGAASGEHDFITGIEGVPAGLKADEKGRLYVGERGVGVYSTAGKREHILLAGEVITNCAFGDNDLETLYASGRKIIYKVRLGVKGAVQY